MSQPIFLLWFDDSPAPVADRIARAANFYEAKHGKKPTRCLLPKGELTTGVTGVICTNDPLVLPGHIWIGSSHAPSDTRNAGPELQVPEA